MGRIDKWEQEMTKFEKDKEQWEEWQKEIAFKKSQVERGLTNYEALLEWQRDPKNKTELGKKKDEFFKYIKDMLMGSGNKNETTYEGTVLDSWNPEKIVERTDSLLKLFGQEFAPWEENPEGDFVPHYSDEERDALRHYIGTQAIVDKYGPVLGSLMVRANEWPSPTDEESSVDIENNLKALADLISGKRLDPSWIKMTKFANEPKSTTVLDSLLKELTIPPPGGDYGK